LDHSPASRDLDGPEILASVGQDLEGVRPPGCVKLSITSTIELRCGTRLIGPRKYSLAIDMVAHLGEDARRLGFLGPLSPNVTDHVQYIAVHHITLPPPDHDSLRQVLLVRQKTCLICEVAVAEQRNEVLMGPNARNTDRSRRATSAAAANHLLGLGMSSCTLLSHPHAITHHQKKHYPSPFLLGSLKGLGF